MGSLYAIDSEEAQKCFELVIKAGLTWAIRQITPLDWSVSVKVSSSWYIGHGSGSDLDEALIGAYDQTRRHFLDCFNEGYLVIPLHEMSEIEGGA